MKDNWKLEYDPILKQHYYLNTMTNTISFDLPCEVRRKNNSFLSKLSFKRKRSNDSCINSTQSDDKKKVSEPDTNQEHLQYNDDEYLYNNPTNFKNFAGTSLTPSTDDNQSIDSNYFDNESIVTFYSDLDENEYNYEEAYTFDKEKERMELRLQFLSELQV